MLPPLFAIFAWPAVSGFVFARLAVPLAILVTILGGLLLLPEGRGLNLPLLPSFNKLTIPVLAAFAFATLHASRSPADSGLPGILPGPLVGRFLFVGFMLTSFLTVLSNRDPLIYGATFLPGMSVYDGFSAALGSLMVFLPALLARKYLATPERHRLVLVVLLVAGLAYSLLALWEIRFSPQLNRHLYGFFPHEFAQHVRGNGFRPLVFLVHGLVLAVIFAMMILAAAGLWRAGGPQRGKFLMGTFWLLAVLVLCKSLGALVIALALLPVALLFSVRAQLMVAAVLASIFLTYPVLRGAHLVPLEGILSIAEDISADRASSLQYRFRNEEEVLEKVQQRPLLGWGGYSRWWIYDPAGRTTTVPDGYWMIVIGSGGWSRYLFEFGFLTLPIFVLLWRSKRERIGFETSTLTLILVANLVDLLPNSGITPLTWLVAGSLWGRVEHAVAPAAARLAAAQADPAMTGIRPGRLPASLARDRPPGYVRPEPEAVPEPVAEPVAAQGREGAYTRQTVRIVRSGPSPRLRRGG